MSSGKYGVVLDDDEVATFLERQGIGTLSMGDERGGYGIPMSFGYDRTRERCIHSRSSPQTERQAPKAIVPSFPPDPPRYGVV